MFKFICSTNMHRKAGKEALHSSNTMDMQAWVMEQGYHWGCSQHVKERENLAGKKT